MSKPSAPTTSTPGNSPSRIRQYVGPATLAAMLTVSACGDITGPSQDSDPQTVLANGPALGGLISEETSRVIPSVVKNGKGDELAASLETLAAALSSGSGNQSKRALSQFNVAMERYETLVDNPDIAAELAAIRHAVDVVREAVEQAK